MNHKEFCSLLKKNGFDFYTGVPCSILSNIIIYMSRSTEFTYIPATREDEAIGVAVGAYMGGKRPVVLMQNSGLGNSINALTSLVLPYQIPLLFIISWRGYQGKDEPEHIFMGKYMIDFLKVMKVPTEIIEKDVVEEQVMRNSRIMEEQKIPIALILKKDVIM